MYFERMWSSLEEWSLTWQGGGSWSWACWMRSGLLSSTESKKSSGISGLRHQWSAGGLTELFSLGPYLPTFSSQVLPFPHPCRRWKISFLKRLSHGYGSRIPGDGKTGTFTENRNWELPDIQTANRHVKRCSASLVIREIQIKSTRYHLTLVRKTITKKSTNNKC